MLDESMFEDIHEIAENSEFINAIEKKEVSGHRATNSEQLTRCSGAAATLVCIASPSCVLAVCIGAVCVLCACVLSGLT